MLLEIMTSKYNGIIHLASDQILSKYDFAQKVANEFNFDRQRIIKGSVIDVPSVAKRPLNTSLDNSLSKKILKTKPISIENGLKLIKNTINF